MLYFKRYYKLNLPIISKATVRCSLPEALVAPKTVPTSAEQIPAMKTIPMNHLMDTVLVASGNVSRPQHDLGVSSSLQ